MTGAANLDERLLELLKEGVARAEIARRLGLRVGQVDHLRQRLIKAGLFEAPAPVPPRASGKVYDEEVGRLSLDGLTEAAIAAQVGITKHQVRAARRRLRDAGRNIDPGAEEICRYGNWRVMARRRGRNRMPYWVAAPSGAITQFDKRINAMAWAEEQERRERRRCRSCLRCAREFVSEGPHNRLCTTCRTTPAESEDDWFQVRI